VAPRRPRQVGTQAEAGFCPSSSACSVSERTVEAHVRSNLSKLGFTTRTEVATWLLRGSRLARAARARYGIEQVKQHGSSGQPG
jgi:hypothetical protein